MVVGEAMFGAPSTPQFVCFGRDIAASWCTWRIVDSSGHVDVECRGLRRAWGVDIEDAGLDAASALA